MQSWPTTPRSGVYHRYCSTLTFGERSLCFDVHREHSLPMRTWLRHVLCDVRHVHVYRRVTSTLITTGLSTLASV
ncbi:hypothetical protein DENSPDRAFT_148248 [Dentipellis sp. KUC8613]|nr:hypothetical protein DENSPDRAFT_148248 [Dentipellis sp. KUC8613]